MLQATREMKDYAWENITSDIDLIVHYEYNSSHFHFFGLEVYLFSWNCRGAIITNPELPPRTLSKV